MRLQWSQQYALVYAVLQLPKALQMQKTRSKMFSCTYFSIIFIYHPRNLQLAATIWPCKAAKASKKMPLARLASNRILFPARQRKSNLLHHTFLPPSSRVYIIWEIRKKQFFSRLSHQKLAFLYTIMGIRGRRKPTHRKGQTVTGNVSSHGGPLWLLLWLVFGCQATHREGF